MTTARVLAWARSVCEEWWSPQDAAAALGVSEDEMRTALGELEDMGLVYRAVASRDAYRVTADGRSGSRRRRDERGRVVRLIAGSLNSWYTRDRRRSGDHKHQNGPLTKAMPASPDRDHVDPEST